MTTDQTAAIDRIPLARHVTYAVRGAPEIADEYNETRTIAPTEISLTYRASPDSQLGRVHAYVKGWWMQDGTRVPMDKPVGRHFHGDLAGWPEWLAAEARLHDPAAVSVPPPPPATRADDLRERITEALHEARRNGLGGMTEAEAVAHMADAVARRMADEEQPATETPTAVLARVCAACDQLHRAAVLADGKPHTDRERGIVQAVTRIRAALTDEPAPVAQQPAAEAWVCKCPAGLCGCGHHAPTEQQAAAADTDEEA